MPPAPAAVFWLLGDIWLARESMGDSYEILGLGVQGFRGLGFRGLGFRVAFFFLF